MTISINNKCLVTLCSKETITIEPGESHIFATGVHKISADEIAYISGDWYLQKCGVYSFGKYYSRNEIGEITVTLYNLGNISHTIKDGDTIGVLRVGTAILI